MADGGKVPLDLQLATSVPLGIRAYRRRFMSPCTNLQTANPDDYVNIYPDTSTPGSFIDPESTYLVFDFTITNGHYCVDYTDFGVEGVGGAIIQDWRVYNQGSILEEILEYGTVASALSNIEGSYEQEVSMYFSSKLKVGFSEEMHQNFIKPPMVDASGNCMFGPNPTGVGIPLVGGGSQYSAAAGGGGSTTAADGVGYFASQLISAQGMSLLSENSTSTGAALGDFTGYPSGGGATNPSANNYSIGSFPFVNTALTSLSAAGIYSVNAVSGWTGSVLGAISAATPMDFPDLFDPSFVNIVRDYTAEFGTINKPQVMANLCNVKCFPIGMVPAKSAYGDKSYEAATSSVAYAATATRTAADVATLVQSGQAVPITADATYRICYRPYSGIFGKLATKMLATTLLAPQQMYINLHLAGAHIALNVSADPCRRISGTIRDYIRNVGTGNTNNYGATTFTLSTSNIFSPYEYATSAYGIGYGPYHSIPITSNVTGVTTAPNTIFNQAAATGRCVTTVSSNGTIGAGAIAQIAALVNAPPTPQYMLVKIPNLYKLITDPANSAAVTYCAENEVFYGTYLPASVPQVARIFSLTYSGATFNGSPPITYKLTNINLAGDQLILPNEVTADIIAQAEAGNFNVHTNSVRTYNLQINNAQTQSIICPLKVNMAKRVLFVFQNNKQRNSSTAWTYDSNCGLNPFAAIYSTSSLASNPNGRNSTATGTSVIPLTGVGFSGPLTYQPTGCSTSNNGGMSVQLRIGNDFYPPQPLTTMQEIVAELCKTLEGWHNSAFSPAVDGQMIPGRQIGVGNMVYDCLQGSKFTTAFIDNALLDDQTITGNDDFVPLYCAKATGSAAATTIGATTTYNSTQYNGYNYLCPRGYCVRNMFKSPSSRFLLGFNMRAFKSSDGCDGGQYLGNNTITLILQGCVGLNVQGESYRAVAIVPHRVAMRYSPGGQLIWAY